jgi:hypothetical protein
MLVLLLEVTIRRPPLEGPMHDMIATLDRYGVAKAPPYEV